MEFFFYIWAILAILWETMVISSPKKVLDFRTRLRNAINEDGEKTSTMKAYGMFTILYFLWVIVGLFTSQYVIFLIILLLGSISKKKVWIVWIDSVVTLGLILFIILNKYHWHINVMQEIFG